MDKKCESQAFSALEQVCSTPQLLGATGLSSPHVTGAIPGCSLPTVASYGCPASPLGLVSQAALSLTKGWGRTWKLEEGGGAWKLQWQQQGTVVG